MNTVVPKAWETMLNKEFACRVHELDWEGIGNDLDAQGSAVIENLIAPAECNALVALYLKDEIFRSRVVMARHGFGRGEYKYFRYPLPEIISDLRNAVYPRLVPTANRWNEAMGKDVRYPVKHADFIGRCHKAGQLRPTPLLLRYGPGDLQLPAPRDHRGTGQ